MRIKTLRLLPSSRRARRGTSLIETLVGLAILALLLIGILQLITMSMLVNAGSAARTQMTFKAQQVAEIVRLHYALIASGTPAGLANSGIPATFAAGTVDIPYDNTDAALWAFWGPAGAYVMEDLKGPYKIRYELTIDNTTPGQTDRLVIVTVIPTDDTSPNRRFFTHGSGANAGKISAQRVDYVAKLPSAGFTFDSI